MAQQEPRARHSRGQLLPHWYSPNDDPLTIVDGSGATVLDDRGNEYLDFLSQLYSVNAGHDERRIIDAIVDQLERIPFVSPAKGNDVRTEFARRLIDIAPATLEDVFFSISGSEANEAAVQFARSYTGGQKVLTRWRSYHGSTYGAASLTGDPQTRAEVERFAGTTGAVKFLPPMMHRSPFDGDTPEEIGEQAADHLEFVIRNEGPESVAAILTEPVAGTSGAYPAPPGYFRRVRELCDEYEILLISDEVITGFGRCGEWFGIQTEDVEPDMLVFAKAATGSYVPLAGVMTRGEVGEWLRENGIPVGQTFAGHPIGCAAGIAALDVYADGLIENVRALSPRLESGLSAIADRFDAVGSVHGRGFLWSVEFTDPESGKPFFDPRVDEGDNPVAAVRAAAQERGVLFGSGRPDVQILVAPPLSVTEGEIDRAIDVLTSAIETVFGNPDP